MIQEPAPNTSSVWIQLITTLGTILTVIISHWLSNRKADRTNASVQEVKDINTQQSAKLETVHSLVNGDRLEKAKRITELETKLRMMGVQEP